MGHDPGPFCYHLGMHGAGVFDILAGVRLCRSRGARWVERRIFFRSGSEFFETTLAAEVQVAPPNSSEPAARAGSTVIPHTGSRTST